MKKVVLSLMVLVLCLCGCGKEESNNSSAEQQEVSIDYPAPTEKSDLSGINATVKTVSGSTVSVTTIGNPEAWYDFQVVNPDDPITTDSRHYFELFGQIPEDFTGKTPLESGPKPIAVSFLERAKVDDPFVPISDFVTTPVKVKAGRDYAVIFDCSAFPETSGIDLDSCRWYCTPKLLDDGETGQIVFGIYSKDDFITYEAVLSFKADGDIRLSYEVVENVEQEYGNVFALWFWVEPTGE